MIKPEDFVHSLVPHNKQYQKKTLLPSLLYEPVKWRISSQFTDSEVRATFWGTQDFVSRRESFKRPVSKHINSRLRSTKYNDLYETTHPSLGLISLFCVCPLEQNAAKSIKL